jgi:predicted DNA-binding transcriptional regulator YafY
MPANLQAIIRYNIIDKCIRDTTRVWQWHDLALAISDALKDQKNIDRLPSKRTIMGDIAAMRSGELGYTAPIIHSKETGYRYANPRFSIHNVVMPPTLISDLKEGISLIQQLTKNEKLDHITSSLTRICEYLHIAYEHEYTPVIYFEHSLNEPGQRWLDKVYEYICNKKTICVRYQPFGQEERIHFIAPAFIKEYNKRWYLFGYDFDKDKIINLALDRFLDIQLSLKPYYIPENFSYEAHFKHLYGVTLPDDTDPIKIIFTTDIPLMYYMDTKPIHPSQSKIDQTDTAAVYELFVYDNYEIRSKLKSFGGVLQVIDPPEFDF